MDANAPLTQDQAGVAPTEQAMAQPVDELANFFTYHEPTAREITLYETINIAALELARTIDRCCPPGSDRTAAVRLVREARMTANAAIACRGANYR